ncbi:MAG: ATPase [Flavobacteriales bacterium]|nr:ATPase [Flavobacteriales bacterium]
MILIVDSGSTKSDWVILNSEGKEEFRTETIGFNPYFISTKEIEAEIGKNEQLVELKEKATQVFFYGAGCSSEKMNAVVEKALSKCFVNAEITVDHDLLGAAYAAYNGKPAIVCILGTGSNSCYFDGEKLEEATPSLAYILGDEGSGNNLGKRILQAYFLKKMPKRLCQAFKERYNLTIEQLNKNVYQNQFANTYLATFSRFVSDHKYEPFIQKLIYDSMKEFVVNQILPYKEARFSEINFIGSVAHYYEEILYAVAAEFHLKIGFVIRKPIDNLVKYHLLYILPKKEGVKA